MRRFEIGALIIFFLLAFSYFSWKVFADVLADDKYAHAEKLFSSKKYSEFLTESEALLKTHLKDGNLRYLRALAFREVKDLDRSLAEIDACLSLGYPEAQALVLKADIMGEEKDDQKKRLEAASKAISLDPSYDAGYYQKGLAYLYEKEYKLAEAEFLTVFSQKGELVYDAALNLAEIYINGKEFEKAEEKINFVLKKYPRSPQALYALSALKRKTGDFQAALSAISQAISYGEKEYLYSRSLLCEEIGDFPCAFRDFIAWPGFLKYQSKDDLARAAKLAFRAGENGKAEKFIEKFFEKGEPGCEKLILRGRIFFKEGKLNEAEKDFSSALKDKKCFSQANFMLENLPKKKN